MRVVSGFYKGCRLTAPKGESTRPMTDKMRAALFDMAGDVDGLIVLDAYAGSGAVAIEALSRGASNATMIDYGRSAIEAIKKNLQHIQISHGYNIHQEDLGAWLDRQAVIGAEPYDMIVADPPYEDLDPRTIEKLGAKLRPKGILAVSHSSKLSSPDLAGLELIKHKTYGDSALSIYRPMS